MKKLTIQNVLKRYKTRTVVREFSATINTGQVVGLLGPNGAGKTTVFSMIIGLIYPDQGSIYLQEHNITHLPMHKRARLGISYLPQETSIFRKLNVSQNIMAVLELRPELTKKQRRQQLSNLLHEFNISHLKDMPSVSLSGGEKRRVEIARALAINPQFILLDEPFAGIDPISVVDIKGIISHLAQRGIGVLITDHNVRETLDICQKAYIVNEGTTIAQGTTQDILSNAKVREVYLGDEFNL